MDTITSNTLEDISAWISSKVIFGHVKFSRTEYMNLTLRAKTLISQCQVEGVAHVVYSVPNSREKDLLVADLSTQGVEAETGWDTTSKICIIDHAALYEMAQTTGCGGFLNPDVVVICEVDVHYSLEFALSMACLMYGAKDLQGGAHVLTVSHQDVEEPLRCLLKVLAPSLARFKQFDIGHETLEQDFIVYHDDAAFFRETLVPPIVNALSQKQDVLFFGSPRDARLYDAVINELTNSGVHFRQMKLSNKHLPISNLLKAIKRDPNDTHVFDGHRTPRQPFPVLYVIVGTERLPFAIKDLGLVIVSRYRSGTEFDTLSSHVVHTIVERSDVEIREAMAHAYLSAKQPREVMVLSNAPLGSSKLQMPRRRLENDQNMAFIFELLHQCGDVHLGKILNCFVTDVLAISEVFRRLLVSRWIKENDDDMPRRYAARPTETSRLLKSLLPMFDYDFAPAAFLAGFANDESESVVRAAIRVAAIVHQVPDVLVRYDMGSMAAILGQTHKEVEKHLFNFLHYMCQMPSGLLAKGSLWVKLAVWHVIAKHTNGFDCSLRTEETAANRQFHLVIPGFVLSVDAMACVRVDERVRRLEGHHRFMLRSPPVGTPHPTLDLKESDVERIEEELVNTWFHRILWINRDLKKILDHASLRCDNVTMAGLEHFNLDVPTTRGTPQIGYYAFALEIIKKWGVQDEPIAWGMDKLVVLPFEAIVSWQEKTGRLIAQVVTSTYPFHN